MLLFSDFSLVTYDANNRFLRLLVVNYSIVCFQLDLAFLFWAGGVKSVIFSTTLNSQFPVMKV